MSSKSETWLIKYWRPMMAVTYMIVIIFDFVIAPVGWSLLQAFASNVITQWSPLTLLSGGIFHFTMCSVLGISAFTRGQEKLEQIRADNSKDQ